MTIAGIRCTPKKIYYSIIVFKENDTFTLINQKLIIPVSFNIPDKLKYVRKTILDIFLEYNVIRAGIRVTENNAQSPDRFRLMLEAIVQELIASSYVEAYFTGLKGSISKRLDIPNDGTITEVIEGRSVFNGITDWSSFSTEHRESILVGFASSTL
ncbi:hypothetical protein C7447_103492 [Tenacibaculum adriaticum]|uniref:Uncharacterized protein n=1 Tax=Tenacibaculum adriaticum TaxID=413713 RepID=A0A5S5DUM8_9FLAO|nr:hypothetical protein [Tenacibaculum adriaticum]TYP98319.1 hypothetical protein C7447_103492 [Tenacibaculum adriaticum]